MMTSVELRLPVAAAVRARALRTWAVRLGE